MKNVKQISQKLLQDDEFIINLRSKLHSPFKISQLDIDSAIDDLSQVIRLLIHHKLELQMQNLIVDNEILFKIKNNIQKSRDGLITKPNDVSFTDIHNLMIGDYKKIYEQLGQNQKSLTIDQYDDIGDKFNQLQKKVKAMEDKYQTNLKSLWNVLSMTQAAVFDFIKESQNAKIQKQRQIQNYIIHEAKEKQKSGIFGALWRK